MAIKKSLLIVGAVSTIGLATLVGANAATAATGQDSLVEKIATKFNLNKDEVATVFEEYKDEKQVERQAEVAQDLQDKVDAGDITVEQKTLIENKMKEIQAARETEHDELETWAEQNGIDRKYLRVGGHHGNGNKLQDAVDAGDITVEQKTLIENKKSELEDKRKAARDALEKWAEDNKLDLKDIMPFGGGRGHGFGGPGGMH